MTPEEQRIAIAEKCGKHAFVPFDKAYPTPVCKCGKDIESHAEVPDYCNDRNAMYEVIVSLGSERFGLFLAHLMEVTKCDRPIPRLASLQDFERAFKATAAQLAEAFLRTVGAWKD